MRETAVAQGQKRNEVHSFISVNGGDVESDRPAKYELCAVA